MVLHAHKMTAHFASLTFLYLHFSSTLLAFNHELIHSLTYLFITSRLPAKVLKVRLGLLLPFNPLLPPLPSVTDLLTRWRVIG